MLMQWVNLTATLSSGSSSHFISFIYWEHMAKAIYTLSKCQPIPDEPDKFCSVTDPALFNKCRFLLLTFVEGACSNILLEQWQHAIRCSHCMDSLKLLLAEICFIIFVRTSG